MPYRRHYLYLVQTGRLPHFSSPRTFNEKVNWRIINDRRPILADCCDKLTMKDLARARVPEHDLLRIPETYWSGTDLREIGELPAHGQWVLKPNHSSGDVLLGPATLEEAVARSEGWLDSKPAELLGEWGYAKARPLLLLEELIPHEGPSLTDYKFFCFDGEPRDVLVVRGRGTSHRTSVHYDPQWNLLARAWDAGDHVEAPPARLEDMLEVARRLSAGFDFMRIDLYSIGNQIWFSEFSPYPHGGLALLRPREHGRALGEMWTLPALTPDGTAIRAGAPGTTDVAGFLANDDHEPDTAPAP